MMDAIPHLHCNCPACEQARQRADDAELDAMRQENAWLLTRMVKLERLYQTMHDHAQYEKQHVAVREALAALDGGRREG